MTTVPSVVGAPPAGAATAPRDATGDAAALEGGSYEVIRKRLVDQGVELAQKAESLNAKRKQVFGGGELALIANERVRTEHNGIARDVISVAGHLLVGFHVFLGLKTETNVSDVFAFYKFAPASAAGAGGEGASGSSGEGEWDLSPAPFEGPGAFLADPEFVKELRDVFKYTKEARLLRLARTDTRLLAVVQIGATLRDVKVFRWSIDAGGRVKYMDARGDDDAKIPRQHDFAWTPTRREDQVAGPHPHVNVLDTVFVETVGGDLTIKVENNTKDGRGIYREPVDDPNQTLDDADIAYAKVGQLVLLRIKPFREEAYRYVVFDPRSQHVARIDAIGQACHSLPEDHGIVFPGGYFLQNGEHKVFEGTGHDRALWFERVIRSPNGEDVLYVYHADESGEYLLLPYNLIKKEIASPLRCHGYSLFADGTMAIFRAVAEPTRVHPLQIWKTPFSTAEHAAARPRDGSYLAKVGNADLVRGISDALSIRRMIAIEKPTRATYEDLVAAVTRAIDAHYWLGNAETFDLLSTLQSMRKTSELVLDEFDKVEAIARRAEEALEKARVGQKELLTKVRPDDLHVVEDFLRALTTLRTQRGQLISLKEVRGIDLLALAALEQELVGRTDEVGKACVAFFLREDAFKPLVDRLDAVVTKVEAVAKVTDLTPIGEELDLVQQGLTILTEVTGSLAIDDATARTRILEGISAAFAQQNRARAVFVAKKKELAGNEGRAEFGAQFRLFGQAVTGAIALCDSPEACDEQLSKLLLSLEELEGKFGDLDEFTADLAQKREEVNDAIGARRQQLLDERHRRAQNLMTAAERILAGVGRRARTFKTIDELNAYFASDAMVLKVADVQKQLADLGDAVKSEEVASRIKSARQEAIRALRDKTELFEGGDDVIKLGQHRFSVHTQPLELVLVPREGTMTLHLTGTDFFEPIADPALESARDLWDQTLVSETNDVYRGEFLAASMLFDAEDGKSGLSIEGLTALASGVASPRGAAANAEGASPGGASSVAAPSGGSLVDVVRAYAQDRLDEGYERGIHDADAALILERLLALRASAGLLRFSPLSRTAAVLWFGTLEADAKKVLHARARSFGRLRAETNSGRAQGELAREIETPVAERARSLGLTLTTGDVASAARYLVQELAQERVRFVASGVADSLARGLLASLDEGGSRRAFEEELRVLEAHLGARLGVAIAYVDAFVTTKKIEHARPFVVEAAAILCDPRTEREPSSASVEASVTGLVGAHPRIQARAMPLAIDAFLTKMAPFVSEAAPRFRAFRKTKAEIVERQKARLRMNEWTPRVLTSFVRNRLIDEVYLPLVGANLAKQLGAQGEKKRTDLMGMLLLVSPPGYGKTTLMEYVASKLGLVFMKVNGPSIGHDVTSLDPSEAKNGTARQEVEKINLAFEMGQNVMLYLDDIQHTSSELLQKFISLCDAQRRVEGVWNGKTRTYDLRGKKFCIVMAGNPYTESGARFQIPDMLANRADTYNLGDILGGQEALFASSYVENALTSNAVLAPLATREPADVLRLLRMAKGEDVPLTELSHGYSGAEVEEILGVLRHMTTVQALLLAVNKQYILSASQEDAYRSEPPFKLQGSYRNMNKLAEKIVAAMNADELQRLVTDHYTSESQTLTTGAEQNLLKLAELRGMLDDVQAARWKEIKDAYVRTRRAGGKADDPVARVTGALAGLDEQLSKIHEGIASANEAKAAAAVASSAAAARRGPDEGLAAILAKLDESLRALSRPKVDVTLDDAAARGTADAFATVAREHAQAIEKIVAALTTAPRPAPAPLVPPRPGPRVAETDPFGGLGGHPPAPGPGAQGHLPSPAASPAFDARVDELLAVVRRLEGRITAAATAHAARFTVELGITSASTFFRSLEGEDVVRFGGVFVATYAKLPALGATVILDFAFPGGLRAECQGQVVWLKDDLGEDSHAGFGARLVAPTTDLCAMIAQFVQHRDPLLRD